MNYLLSIIVTSYNIKNYIEECIDSIVKSSAENYEIIFVDDGSNDGTVDIIKKFHAEKENVKTVFIEENTVGGVATAANIGLRHATGEYIAFADGDDIFEPEIFSKMLDSAQKYNSDVVICDYKEFFASEEGENILQDHAYEGRWQDLCDRRFIDLNLEQNLRKDILTLIAVPWRKLYKRSFLQAKTIFFPEGDFFFEDNAFHWFVVTQASSVSFINEVLYFHRKNRVGQTMGSAGSALIKIFIQHEIIVDFLRKKNLFFTYKNSVMLWLFNQICWVHLNIDPKFHAVFFNVVRKNFLLYSNRDFRDFFATYKFDVKIIEIWYSLYNDDFALFNKIMSGVVDRNFIHRFKFNSSQVGLTKSLVISASFIKNITTAKFTERFIKDKILRFKNVYGNNNNTVPDSGIGIINIKLDELQAAARNIEMEIHRLKQEGRERDELTTSSLILLDRFLRNNIEEKEKIQNWCRPIEKPKAMYGDGEPHLTFPKKEAEYLTDIYKNHDVILEYGSGGSTLLAAQQKHSIVMSVESDKEWVENLEKVIAQNYPKANVLLQYVDIGDTGEWGFPMDESQWRNWHNYPLSIWSHSRFKMPDLVLIDGRFRVGCFMATLLSCKKPVTVLWDDYKDRSSYHVVEEYVKPVAMIGRMARFELVPQTLPTDRLAQIVAFMNTSE
ncbi:glycosyltransferase family 2 protein [Acetobacter tropicalis]|nr:glycosyltransferase family 2 protein [Acetobacter tropicalis]